jgi:ribosomal protein S27E
MFKSQLLKQGIIEVSLGKQEMRDFRESLIISNTKRAFGVTDHQTAVQAIKGLKRKFFLVDTIKDLDYLKSHVLVEKVVLIHKNRLANFIVVCPNCEERQFFSGPKALTLCLGCGVKFTTPGHGQ